jgi:hypothetical protein
LSVDVRDAFAFGKRDQAVRRAIGLHAHERRAERFGQRDVPLFCLPLALFFRPVKAAKEAAISRAT